MLAKPTIIGGFASNKRFSKHVNYSVLIDSQIVKTLYGLLVLSRKVGEGPGTPSLNIVQHSQTPLACLQMLGVQGCSAVCGGIHHALLI